MPSGNGKTTSSRNASKSPSSKMGAKSSQSGIKSSTSKIGSAASANRSVANRTKVVDRGMAGVPGGVSRSGGTLAPKQKTQFERFKDRYPRGLKDMDVRSIPAPMPGGFGPAGNVVARGLTGARSFVGNMFGAGKRVAEAQKRISDLKKMEPALERLKQSEAIRMGKPSVAAKLPDKLPPMKLSQIREANKPIRGYKTWEKVEDTIDKITEGAGFGTGPMARLKAAAVTGVPGQAAYEAVKSYRDGYRKGGAVKTRGNASKTRKKK